MKKSLMIFLCLLIMSGVGLGWCIRSIHSEQDQIVITEQTLQGDISAADGLTVKIDTQWETDQIRWETVLSIDGEAEQPLAVQSQSELRYNERRTDSRIGSYLIRDSEILSLSYDDGYHFGYAGGDEMIETVKGDGILSEVKYRSFGNMVAKVAWEAKADSVYTKEVYLTDYYSYYPLYMDMRAEVSTVWYVDEWNIGEYLRVKIPEEHMMKVSITKNGNGAVTEIAAESISGSIEVKSPAVMTDRSVFYTVYAVSRDDGELVTPEMKYGNGIYCLPFVDEEDGRNMKTEAMELVYALSEDVCPIGLVADPSGELLYLAVKEEGLLKLKTIALDYSAAAPGSVPKTEEIAELTLTDYPDNSELFLMELVGEQLTEEQQKEEQLTEEKQIPKHLLMVFRDGTLVFRPDLRQTVEEQPSANESVIRGKITTDSMGYGNASAWDHSLDYQDGKLALVCAESYWNCSFRVYVFDKEGEQYQGTFRHSLDYQSAYRDYTLQAEDALEISW